MDELYTNDGPERVGFVLKNGTIVEVANVAKEPETGFEVDGAEILKHLEIAKGTWHTHPGRDANLSMADYRTFLRFPAWEHWIIGGAGDIRRYYVEDGAVLCDE